MLKGKDMSDTIKASAKFIVEMAPDASDEVIKSNSLKISQLDGVDLSSVQFIPRDEAFTAVFDDDKIVSDLDSVNPFLDILLFNLLPEAYSPDVISSLEKQVLALPKVNNLIYENSHVDNIEATFGKVKWILGIVALILIILVIVLLHHVTRLLLLSRASEIRIMELVGATSDFIRKPFLYQSLKSGFVSAVLASILITLMLLLMSAYFGTVGGVLQWQHLILVCTSLFVIGISVAIVSTYIIVNLYLKDFSQIS